MVLFSSVPQVPKLSKTTYFFQNTFEISFENLCECKMFFDNMFAQGVFNIKMEVEKLVVLSF